MLRWHVHAPKAPAKATTHLGQEGPRLAKAPGQEKLESFPVQVVRLPERGRCRSPTRPDLPNLRCRLSALEDEVTNRSCNVAFVKVICFLEALIGHEAGSAEVGVDALQARCHVHTVTKDSILYPSLRANVPDQNLSRVDAATHTNAQALCPLENICGCPDRMLFVVDDLVGSVEDGQDLITDEFQESAPKAFDGVGDFAVDGTK
mmetsp:Transcript_16352/g.37124  ORF Transcript_16352/g.37124 Transcript_16352/m.37124 type:complete len:205 (-) Transcript_16352:71-685(-)